MNKKKRKLLLIVLISLISIVAVTGVVWNMTSQSGISSSQVIPEIVGNQLLGVAYTSYSGNIPSLIYYPINPITEIVWRHKTAERQGWVQRLDFLGETLIPTDYFEGTNNEFYTNKLSSYNKDGVYYKLTATMSPPYSTILHTKFIENNIFEIVDVQHNYITDNPYFYKDIEPKIITIKLNSKYPTAIKEVNLFVWLEDTLNIAGKHIIDLSRSVVINPGLNEYVFELPSGLEIQQYKSKFVFTVRQLKDNACSLVNYPCCFLNNQYNTLSYCGSVQLTNIMEDTFIVSPKPIYLIVEKGDSCIEGYEFAIGKDESEDIITSDTICVRSDLSSLPCVVLGVPQNVNQTFMCSSSGIPVEFISQPSGCKSDAGCGTGKTCSVSDGTCWNTIIYEKIIQCNVDEDCPKSCPDITVTCGLNNRCEFSGECKPIISERIVECTENEKWDYESRPLCKGLTANCVDTKWSFEGKCESPEIPPEEPTEFNLLWIVGIGIVFILIILFLYLILRGKKD